MVYPTFANSTGEVDDRWVSVALDSILSCLHEDNLSYIDKLYGIYRIATLSKGQKPLSYDLFLESVLKVNYEKKED